MGHRRDINRVSLPSLKQKHIPKSEPAAQCLSTKRSVPIGHQSDITLLQNGKSKQLCEREREKERSSVWARLSEKEPGKILHGADWAPHL